MNRRATISAVLAGAFCCLAYACDKDGEPGGGRQAVEIEVSLDGNARSRVTTSGNLFEEGDEFRLFFNSAVPTNAIPTDPDSDESLKITDYVYNSSGKWTPAPPLYWDDYKPAARQFCAAMPFGSGSGYTAGTDEAGHTFAVQADQTAADNSGYKKSDLLMARVSTEKRLIPLTFYHMMAKVVVEVKATTDVDNPAAFNADAFDAMTVSLNNIFRTGAITFGTLTPDDSGYNPAISVVGNDNKGDVGMLQLTEAAVHQSDDMLTMSFVALIPPQTVDEGTILFTFSDVERNRIYYMKVPTGGADFEQEKSTRVTVTLDKQKVEIAEVDTNVKIDEWGAIAITHDDPIKLPED